MKIKIYPLMLIAVLILALGVISIPEAAAAKEKRIHRKREAVATWYSRKDRHVRKRTANGEIFDDSKHTCAAWGHPFGTKLKVVNLENKKYVVCRVNDRGPAKRLGRQIDLTKAAFRRIANLRQGLIKVIIVPIS